MLIKTIKVTQPRNVLIQIPSFIIADWGITKPEDNLEVHYTDGKVIIMPANRNKQNDVKQPVVRGRSNFPQKDL